MLFPRRIKAVIGVGGAPSVMRKEVANNDDVSDVNLGDCWYSTDREAAEKIRLRYE